jgi:signal transduction histidine kinase
MSILPGTLPQYVARAVTRLPALPVDLLIAGVAEADLMWGVTQSQAMNVSSGLGPWPWWIWVSVALLPVPLVWRRRAPFGVLLLTGGSMVLLSVVGNLAVTYDHSSEPMLLITMATVAYYCTGWKFWFAAVISVGFNFVVVTQGFGKSSITALVIAMAFVAGRLSAQQRDLARLMGERADSAEQTAQARVAQAAAEERTRIARDMHDILAHAVSLMIVQAEAGGAIVHRDPVRAERAFDAIGDGGREALTQLRRMLGVLRDGDSPALSPQPTIAELPRLVETVRATKVDVRLVVAGVPQQLPRDTEVALYRTAQEALTNMVKYAKADRAELRVDWSADAVTVRVTDDGIGPQPASAHGAPGGTIGGVGSGSGLIGIRERIAACGGTVQTGPGPDGRGFQVLVRVPTD